MGINNRIFSVDERKHPKTLNHIKEWREHGINLSDNVCKGIDLVWEQEHHNETLDKVLAEQRLRERNQRLRLEAQAFLDQRSDRGKILELDSPEEILFYRDLFRKLFYQYQDAAKILEQCKLSNASSIVKMDGSGEKLLG